ncbi:MAG: AraC family transcriptional regulator [Erysipelotrichaceae bacterium]|nr:AraC family transcriptional regulator [Erysipelotrichaceae bacterium]
MNNIELFVDILSCSYPVYLWTYDPEGRLISTTCTDLSFLEIGPFVSHHQTICAEAAVHERPSFLTGVFQTMWLADTLRNEGKIEKIYALGPFFIDAYPEKYVRTTVEELRLPMVTRQKLMAQFDELPVISFNKISEYAVMMHYAITGERINVYDLHIGTENHEVDNDSEEEEGTKIHGTYKIEQQMLKMVSEGDLRLLDYMKRMSTYSEVGKLANNDSEPLRQLKNTILVAITLFSRAAINGGLYPDTAMTLTDRYFQAVEAADSFRELTEITVAMQSDFVNRVHKIKNNPGRSKSVSNILDYISIHIEDEIRLSDLANEFGYTEYYLSKKFRKEVGKTLKEYIRDVRLDYAKFLLENEKIPIREISDRLRFTSQSYFSERFKEKYGITPNEYRLKNN